MQTFTVRLSQECWELAEDLPGAAQNYIRVVEEAVGAPVDIISTGPDRNETIVLNDPFAGARGI